MSKASKAELLMVDLVNGERAKAGLEPLSVNDNLNTSSEVHSRAMLNSDFFDHTGVDGSSPTTRIEKAGYQLDGNWATAENIGWQSERGAPGIEDDVRAIHENLMNSPSHRANILNPNVEEIGIGIEEGKFTSGNGEFDSVMVTQNFGKTDAPATAAVASAAGAQPTATAATSPPPPPPADTMPTTGTTPLPTTTETNETATSMSTITETAVATADTNSPTGAPEVNTSTSNSGTGNDAWAFATSISDGQQSGESAIAFSLASDEMGNVEFMGRDLTPAEVADVQAELDSITASLGLDPIVLDDWSCPT